MRKGRVPKNGYVYLLQCQNDDSAYKYGCTTLTPEARCKRINRAKRGFDFKVIASFESNDIFNDENKIKWNMLPLGIGALGEFFYSCDDFTYSKEELVTMFLSAAGIAEV